MGTRGTFGHNVENNNITHKVSPRAFNPLTGENMFFVICPTHQMKNIVSQLYASRQNGTKAFEKDGIQFGWQAIKDVYQNDLDNARQGRMALVPGLKLSYVYRDSWTRLNVKPSKIMTQRPMIAALRILADREQNADAKASIQMTANYLETCYKVFEAGILSSYTIRQRNQTVLQSILEGNEFFEGWITTLLLNPLGYDATNSGQKKFLSWQTWDLQRVMIYGFKEFCQDFFNKYGDNFFIAPKRLNGSAIETLFSQWKYIAGGQLTAANYDVARGSYLTRVAIHGQHHGEENYRDVPLYLRQWQLIHRR